LQQGDDHLLLSCLGLLGCPFNRPKPCCLTDCKDTMPPAGSFELLFYKFLEVTRSLDVALEFCRRSCCGFLGRDRLRLGFLVLLFLLWLHRYFDCNLRRCQQLKQTPSRGRDSNRSVIDQGHLHHGLENAILDPVRHIAFLHFFVEVLVQLPGLIRG